MNYKRIYNPNISRWGLEFDSGRVLYVKVKNIRTLDDERITLLLDSVFGDTSRWFYLETREEDLFFKIFKKTEYSSVEEVLEAVEEAKEFGLVEVEGRLYKW